MLLNIILIIINEIFQKGVQPERWTVGLFYLLLIFTSLF